MLKRFLTMKYAEIAEPIFYQSVPFLKVFFRQNLAQNARKRVAFYIPYFTQVISEISVVFEFFQLNNLALPESTLKITTKDGNRAKKTTNTN